MITRTSQLVAAAVAALVVLVGAPAPAQSSAAGDYANLGRPEWHRRRKIVVRRTGDHLVAAWEPHGMYVSNNLFVVLPRRETGAAEQRALVAVLNSRLLTWCFRAQVPRVGRLKRLRELDEELARMIQAALELRASELRKGMSMEVVSFVLVHSVRALCHAAVIDQPELLSNPELEREITRLVLRTVLP